MNLLLVEDDENKRQQLAEYLTQWASKLHYATSYHSAMDALETDEWDLVILDMTIPTFDVAGSTYGGRPQAYGGREILEQIDMFERKMPAIVVTQFEHFGDARHGMSLEQLDTQLKLEFGDFYIGAVYYNSSRDDWRRSLTKMLSRVSATIPR